MLREVSLRDRPNAVGLPADRDIVNSGTPYVLRQQSISLRNVKSYAGISSNRLELLEDRLKSDVLAELDTFEGRTLVATEREDGSVAPAWEPIDEPRQVKTLREAMDLIGHDACDGAFRYLRVPITAEQFPEFSDRESTVSAPLCPELTRRAPCSSRHHRGRHRAGHGRVCDYCE